jgi:hypothetical protein
LRKKQFALIREIRVKARRLILIFARPRIQTALITSRVNFVKNLTLFLFSVLLLTGCTTGKTYKPNVAAQPPKPPGYPIPLYNSDVRIPRPCQLIGEITIGDTGFTMFGGSAKDVMKSLMDIAHEKGADVVQVISMEKPGFTSQNYGVDANLLRYADTWETVAISEKDFLAYLQQHQQTLDPIEGVWSDGSPELIGIIKDASKPGRNFVAFTLNSPVPSWRKGYKKMDITRAARPGSYGLKYYREDFDEADTTILLDHNRAFSFIIRAVDGAYPITFGKINAPVLVN